VIVAREQEKLDAAKKEIEEALKSASNSNGGTVVTASADLADLDSCDRVAAR